MGMTGYFYVLMIVFTEYEACDIAYQADLGTVMRFVKF